MRVQNERGQATPLVLAAVVLVAVMMIATAGFGGRLVRQEQAQAAADAAALAGVSGGRAAAMQLAAANGAELVSYAEEGVDEVTRIRLTVRVTVRVHDATATARATRAP
jgi:hypothetical protein